MIKTVKPVIQEIFQYHKHDPVYYRVGECEKLMIEEIQQYGNIHTPDDQVDQAVAQHQEQVGGGIFPGVQFPVAIIAQQQLYPDNDNIYRGADEYEPLFFQTVHTREVEAQKYNQLRFDRIFGR